MILGNVSKMIVSKIIDRDSQHCSIHLTALKLQYFNIFGHGTRFLRCYILISVCIQYEHKDATENISGLMNLFFGLMFVHTYNMCLMVTPTTS